MLKTIMKQKKFIFLRHAVTIFFLFLLLIFLFSNKNTLIIQMSSNDSSTLPAEIYYASKGEQFSSERISPLETVKGTFYYFIIPDLKSFNYLRLDPAKSIKKIKIHKDIIIIKSKWFKKYAYKTDVTKAEPVYQIGKYSVNKQGVDFTTIGKDPQLILNLTHTYLYKITDYHPIYLLIAILLYLTLIFLYRLSKTTQLDNYLISKLILYTLVLAFATFKVNYYKEHVRFIYTPDIVGHFSYIKDMHDSPTLLPKFENMYMITNHKAGNHLGHPPLYYLLMSLAYDDKLTSIQIADHLRSFNILLFITSILLLLYLGFQSNLSILGHFTYLTIITSIPMSAYLGSAITNDNLAFLGGVLFLLGLKYFLEKNENLSTYTLIFGGLFIAFFSKFTAALLIAFAIFYLLIYLYKEKYTIVLSKSKIILIAFFTLPIILYQVHIIIDYHAIVPTLNFTHPNEYLHSVYYIQEDQRHYKTLWEWIQLYGQGIQSGWFGIHSHHSLPKHHLTEYFGLLILHFIALITLFLPCEKNNNSFCIVGKITIVALLTVGIIQLLFGYKTHLSSGYIGGLQPRYLLPFMVGFAIMASIFVNRFNKYFLFTIFIIVICIQALYSDFFYFLEYYK